MATCARSLLIASAVLFGKMAESGYCFRRQSMLGVRDAANGEPRSSHQPFAHSGGSRHTQDIPIGLASLWAAAPKKKAAGLEVPAAFLTDANMPLQ
jgi:hypothetical protein